MSYLFYPQVALKLHTHNPESKIIILLRNPIDRSFSHYLMDFRLGLVNESFESIVKKDTKHKKLDLYYQQYIELGMYFQQVKRYLDIFKKENVLIIDSKEFREHTLRTIKQIYEFLNVDSSFEPKINVKHKMDRPFLIKK